MTTIEQRREQFDQVRNAPNHVLMRMEKELRESPDLEEALLSASMGRGSPEVFLWLLGMCEPGALERQAVSLLKSAVDLRNPGMVTYLLGEVEINLADPRFSGFFVRGPTPYDGVRYDYQTLLGGIVLSHVGTSCAPQSFRQAIRGSHLHMARVLRDAGAPVEEAARLVREHEGLEDFGALFAN